MKKYLSFLVFSLLFVNGAFSFDSSELDFSFKPKTSFSAQNVSASDFIGALVEDEGTATQNKTDIPLPPKKLARGFTRFQKLDAFGDVIPDSFLFWRSTLTANQQAAYDEIFKAVMNAESEVVLLTRISTDEVAKIVEAVYYDNPEPFWWACNYSWYYNPSSKIATSVVFKYLFDKSELPNKNREFFNMSLPVIFYANLLETDMEKIKYVHDYLCLSIDYDTVAYKSGNYGGKLQTAWSAVVEYKTVCAGYSRAFAYYMQQLGIPCVVLHGSGHAWNFIQIDGCFYQMDVTWDDGNTLPPYFNLSHSEMQAVTSHAPCETAKKIIDSHPSRSANFKYANYFGNVPLGKPYTYKEFQNIAEDIENPVFAQVFTN